MNLAVTFFLALIPLVVAGQEDIPGKLKRVEEIGAWSSPVGTWAGEYFVESAPQEVFQQLEESGAVATGIGVRVILNEDTASVFFQYTPDAKWSTVESASHVIPDKIAWHILIRNEGGVWLERYFLSFMRIDEEVANFVITRTVHNWYDTGDQEILNTYYVFGAGQVTRVKDIEIP